MVSTARGTPPRVDPPPTTTKHLGTPLRGACDDFDALFVGKRWRFMASRCSPNESISTTPVGAPAIVTVA